MFNWLYIFSNFKFNLSLDFEQCNMMAINASTWEVEGVVTIE
jgi:hypothetical protein